MILRVFRASKVRFGVVCKQQRRSDGDSINEWNERAIDNQENHVRCIGELFGIDGEKEMSLSLEA